MHSDTIDKFINSKILVNHFLELCKDFSPPYREEYIFLNCLRFDKNNSILHLLYEIKRLGSEGKCDVKTFKDEILKLKTLILEVIWYLEIADLTTIQEYIQFHESSNNNDVITRLSQEIYNNILEYSFKQSAIKKEILFCYLKSIFVNSKGETSNTCYMSVLSLVVANLKACLQYNGIDIPDQKHLKLSSLMELLMEAKIKTAIIKFLCLEILNSLLVGSEKPRKAKFKLQEKIKNKVTATNNFKCYKQLSKYLEFDDVQNALRTTVFNKCEYIDWDNMLPFLTFLGTHFKDGWKCIKALANLAVKESFNNFNSTLLEFGFLAARQGSFEKANNFPSYLQWFSSMFSSNLKIINTKKISNFFFSFLTELVPYDVPYYLKVHINRTPWVPADCQSLLSDYICLVKSQLRSLDISFELGIFENISEKNTAVCDVENVLSHFKKTNEVLTSVFQTAMFCKDYYEKKFLSELLSKFEGKKSIRHKFIMKLHSAGKIPNVMFKSYKSLERKD